MLLASYTRQVVTKGCVIKSQNVKIEIFQVEDQYYSWLNLQLTLNKSCEQMQSLTESLYIKK